jgi:hypothetical protein
VPDLTEGTTDSDHDGVPDYLDPIDYRPPSPNPMTFEIAPFAVSANEIGMTATEAFDESPPVGYAFTDAGSPTGGGGGVADGLFRSSRVFTDSGLDANHQYCYAVRARDSASPRHLGGVSEVLCAYTLANLPAGPVVFSNITDSSIQIDFGANENPSHTRYLMSALVGFSLDAIGSVTTTTWTAEGLRCGSNYHVFAFAENDEGVVTTESVDLGTAQTLACPPVPDTDGDGVLDNADNCIEIANTDQRDTDSDFFGNRCDADLNQDGLVTVSDFLILRSVLNTADDHADLNGDGLVTVSDFLILRSGLNKPPGPSYFYQY